MIKDKFSLADNPLKYRNFRFFLLGHFISFIGTWIQQVAQVWLVYELTGSSFYLGVFTFFNAFPMMILSLLGGMIIDTFDRRKLLMLVVFFAMFPPVILGFLTQTGKIGFWTITFLGFLSGCFAAIDTPLRQVFISEIVPIKILVKAISFQSLSFNAARMIGPLIGAFLLSQKKIYLCFYLNALSFLPLFFFLAFFIRPSVSTEARSQPQSKRTAFKEALVYLKENSNLLVVLFLVASFTFFGPSLLVLLPVIVKQFYHGGGKEFGFMSSTVGAGAILGALSVIVRTTMKDKLKNLLAGITLFCVSILVISINHEWYLTLACLVLIGFAFTNFFPVANSYVQENTPSRLRGRVMSLFVTAFLGIYPIGNLFVGFLAEHIPVRLILAIYPIVLFFLGFYLINLAKSREKSII